jgi:REP element-mobilizing transposase RayT
MARPLRLEFAGALYHVTSRGDRREDIYEEETDRLAFLAVLDDVCDIYNWVCHAYCLMNNHYHLLIETPDANLSKGMRQLNGVYTQSFNRSHRRVGHVFQGRYKAILVDKHSYLLEVARYIVLNPVRASLVRSAVEWPWSSYRAMIGYAESPSCLTMDWILSFFGERRLEAIERYRQFVAEGQGQPTLWRHLKGQVFLGRDEFVDEVLALIETDRELSEVPSSQRRPPPLDLSHYRRQNSNRNSAIYEAYRSGGYTMKELGEYFGLHYATVSGIIRNHKSKT